VLPTAAVVGVPLSVPVLESKVAHEGSPLTAKVTTPVAETCGVYEYALPTVTLTAGMPLKIRGVTADALPEGVAVIEPLTVLEVPEEPFAAVFESLPSKQPDNVTANITLKSNRIDISNFPLHGPVRSKIGKTHFRDERD